MTVGRGQNPGTARGRAVRDHGHRAGGRPGARAARRGRRAHRGRRSPARGDCARLRRRCASARARARSCSRASASPSTRRASSPRSTGPASPSARSSRSAPRPPSPACSPAPSPASRCAAAGPPPPRSPAPGVCLLVLGGGGAAGGEVSTAGDRPRARRGRRLRGLRRRDQAHARRRRSSRGDHGHRLRGRAPCAATACSRSCRPAGCSTPGGVALALYLGAIPTALAYILFARGLSRSRRGDRDAHPRRAADGGDPRRDRARRASQRDRGGRRRAGAWRAGGAAPCARPARARRRLPAEATCLRRARSSRSAACRRSTRSRPPCARASSRASSPPGERLPERELTERYARRPPHRAGGAARAGRGGARRDRAEPRRARRERWTAAEVEGLFELRAALELEAAHLALERNDGRLPQERPRRRGGARRGLRPSRPGLERRRRRPQRGPRGARRAAAGSERIARAYDGLAAEMRLFVTSDPAALDARAHGRPARAADRRPRAHGPQALREHLEAGRRSILAPRK